MRERRSLPSLIIGLLLVVGFMTYIIIDKFHYANISEDKLTTVDEEYASYSKTKNHFKITCASGKEYRISKVLASEEMMKNLDAGDLLTISVEDNDIVVLKVNGTYLITLDDCHNIFRKNAKATAIIFSSWLVFLVIITIFTIGGINKKFNNSGKLGGKASEVLDEDLYKKIKESIYEKDGMLRFGYPEEIDYDKEEYTFYKAICDYIEDDKIVLMIDDTEENDSMTYLFYKLNNKFYYDLLSRDSKDKPFEVWDELYWSYPIDADTLDEEQEKYKRALEEYVLYNQDILKIYKEEKKKKLFKK